MKKTSFRSRLYGLVVFLSLFAVCSNRLYAESITYDWGAMGAMGFGVAETENVEKGSIVKMNNRGFVAPSFVIVGWNTIKVPYIASLAADGIITTKMGEFYAFGDSLTVTGDITLYAVWAIDFNGDGYPDYAANLVKPTIFSVFGPGGIPPVEDDSISLRSLPAWNNNHDLKILDDSVYYVGCPYMSDYLISLVSENSFEQMKARPLIPMDLVIEYGGVLEENSMVGGKMQRPLSRIEITADMISNGDFYVDSLLDPYPFMFNSIKKDGQGILKMYFVKAGTDTLVSITDFQRGGIHIPWSWSAPFKDPETGAFTNKLTIKFNIYDKPVFRSEVVNLNVDLQGYIDLKHLSGTPLKYMMRSIDGQTWQPADAPLSNRERIAMGEDVSICLRELDRSAAYQQLIIKDFLSAEFSTPAHPNYYVYCIDLETYYMEQACDSIWNNYFVGDLLYYISNIKPMYDMLLATPGMTRQVAIQACIMMYESMIASSDAHFLNATSKALTMAPLMMPAYGRYLASQVVVPEPYRDVFCLAFAGRNTPLLQREVYIPRTEGVTIKPGYGTHYVESQHNFSFTAQYPGEALMVTTDRMVNGEREELKGQLNANGEYVYVIRQVTQNIILKIGPEYATSISEIDGTGVWSHNNTIHIRVDKADIAGIYSISGQMVKRIELSEGETSVPVQQGVYIVTLKDGSVHKVMVK